MGWSLWTKWTLWSNLNTIWWVCHKCATNITRSFLPNLKFVTYTDSDYGGCKSNRKSTTGGCQFLGGRIVSWQCKKQSCVSTSTCEAEYIAAGSCCAQILWLRNQLLDFGLEYSLIPIFCDNQSAIDMLIYDRTCRGGVNASIWLFKDFLAEYN